METGLRVSISVLGLQSSFTHLARVIVYCSTQHIASNQDKAVVGVQPKVPWIALKQTKCKATKHQTFALP